jgi:glycosyltransferase involved in cell wall biosynthesis
VTVIGFDATPLEEHERTGVGRYVEQLLTALLARADGRRYHLLASRRLPDPPPTGAVRPVGRRLPNRWLWMQAMLPATLRRLRPRLCHFTNGMAPLSCPVPYVLSIYDMSLFMCAHTQPLKSRLLIRSLVPSVARRAAAIITATESARDDIVRVLGLPPTRVHVVSGGVDASFRPIESHVALEQARQRYQLDRPFVLAVGTLEPRKNLGRLTRAFGRLITSGRPEQLVLVGRTGWGRDEARRVASELGIGDDVRTLGYVPKADLPAIYTLARVVAFPSLYEGFGLPIVEAMACGTPVLTSDRSAMAELGRDAALLVDPTDEEAIAHGLTTLLDSASLAARLRDAGLRRALSLRWSTVADRTAAVYDRVATAGARDTAAPDEAYPL